MEASRLAWICSKLQADPIFLAESILLRKFNLWKWPFCYFHSVCNFSRASCGTLNLAVMELISSMVVKLKDRFSWFNSIVQMCFYQKLSRPARREAEVDFFADPSNCLIWKTNVNWEILFETSNVEHRRVRPHWCWSKKKGTRVTLHWPTAHHTHTVAIVSCSISWAIQIDFFQTGL